MRERFSRPITLAAIAASATVISASADRTSAQSAAETGLTAASMLRTPWGEPDLQGIWTDETDTPLQRPGQYANQEFFTAAQRQALDTQRSAVLERADSRENRGTARDVAGAYNSAFVSFKRTGPARR